MPEVAESQTSHLPFGEVVHVTPGGVAPQVLVVCEHASNRVPDWMGGLGLSREALESHVAWDPGALPVAQCIAAALHAPLVSGAISRLVYDCNRPPDAASAIPARSEVYDIPGNQALGAADRAARTREVFEPFSAALSGLIATHRASLSLMLTIHSFTPFYHGAQREVELGVLHGRDERFAKAMMAQVPPDAPFVTRLNAPYSAADGVAHTLDRHGAENGLLNVMIEMRNDLIRSGSAQAGMARHLIDWVQRTMSAITAGEGAR